MAPGTGVVDRNQAVATTGGDSFSEGEAAARLERSGFQGVSALTKGDGGVWRGSKRKDGQAVQVWLDYKGNAGQQGGVTQRNSAPGTNLDGTTGNPPGTAASRAIVMTLGTDITGANPGGTSAVTSR